MDAARSRSADERSLDAAVLVAERDLQVQDGLAVTLEAEVTGLDHAGVNRTDGDLVHVAASDRVVVGHADRRSLGVRFTPRDGSKRTGLNHG